MDVVSHYWYDSGFGGNGDVGWTWACYRYACEHCGKVSKLEDGWVAARRRLFKSMKDDRNA